MANIPAQRFEIQTKLDFPKIMRRLRSECGPTALDDEAELATLLAAVNKDIEGCNGEIDRLRSQMVLVSEQRRKLDEYQSYFGFLQSPIRRLPNELLLRIFDSVCHTNWITSKELESLPALKLSRVCARWRNLARSTPELWARITLSLDAETSLNHFALLDFYLTLSSQALLTINIAGGSAENNIHSEICWMLTAHSIRWKSLLVWCEKVFEMLVSDKPAQYPSLEVLMLPFIDSDTSAHLDTFHDAPKLRDIRLGQFSQVAEVPTKFPWNQVTRLDVNNYPTGIEHLIETCGNLLELEFRETVPSVLGSSSVRASTLKGLCLLLHCPSSWNRRFSGTTLAEVLFSSWTCPSLTSLTIKSGERDERSWPKASFHSFTQRSSFHLTTLALVSVPISDRDFIDALAALPNLLELTIDNGLAEVNPITPLLFQTLHAVVPAGGDIVSSVLVPKLRSLRVRVSETSTQTSQSDRIDAEFVEMVQSRWHSGGLVDVQQNATAANAIACLRSVVLQLVDRKLGRGEEEIFRPLAALERAGMRVAVIGKPREPRYSRYH
ncbi:hypothetical protein D9757_007361 [Collybiopsis confluens]|uniref:F-box domain-containing protein n=1 Tax=Collybiopsis confluens TaxID=2823264 RepID=A0A8H5M7U4_9AGAR|nr:hypothetical protein D9757_007361 [Collybiopsis confluens]